MKKRKTGLTKKVLACVLSAAMLLTASCGKDDTTQGGAATGGSAQGTGNENSSGASDGNQPAGGNGAGNSGDAGEGGAGGGTVDDTVTIDAIYQEVKEAYGEDYLPDMLLSEDEIQVLYGIEPEWCEEILVEIPMMSAHVDTFLAVKAKPEHLADVSDAVNAYVENLKSDTMQYPMNLNKIAASTVVTMGNYVFYIMLGYLPTEMDEEADDVQITAYEELNQTAIDAIERVLLK